MAGGVRKLDDALGALSSVLEALLPSWRGRDAGVRVLTDIAATRYHLTRGAKAPPLLAIFGGTGAGKSTLLNRLLGTDVAATSFRRTYTAGAIAVCGASSNIPLDWLGCPHSQLAPEKLPLRGQLDQLSIYSVETELTAKLTLIDTPDLDGDQPAHHAQADRVFRWADAALFLVTPEKYQLPDLLPYYRLAARYELPAFYVINKAEEQAVADDYAGQIGSEVFVIPRDDAAFEPPAQRNLAALRQSLDTLQIPAAINGVQRRAGDLLQRLRDQILEPAQRDRATADRLTAALRAIEAPPALINVHPLTQQLQRRLQQRSVLYLIGPGRLLDRVRQVPGLLSRLPRSTWDLLRHGKATVPQPGDGVDLSAARTLDFRTTLIDQFTVVQSRIDDVLRGDPSAAKWIDSSYAAAKLDPQSAGLIVDEELAALKTWLDLHWHATPRDTAILQYLLKVVPGGAKLTQWSEAAPYLLALVVLTHHAFFGHIDMMILGGYSVATWLTEKISNQVASRTRRANDAITRRFAELAHEQIERACTWLADGAPTTKQLQQLADLIDAVADNLDKAAA